MRNAGLTQPIVAGGSIYSPKFLELGGDAVNGVLTTVPSSRTSRAPRCRTS